MRSTASLSSSSASILMSSSRASPILSLSFESTTKIKPCVRLEEELSTMNEVLYLLAFATNSYKYFRIYKHLRILEVVAPQRPDLVLTADIPDRERDVLVLDRLDVEAWKGCQCHIEYLTDIRKAQFGA